MIKLFLSIFLIFIPFISNSPDYLRGIAVSNYMTLADMQLLHASWYRYYDSPCPLDNLCIPTSMMGEDLNFSPDYSGYLILFNEPDVPFGSPGYVSISDTVTIYNNFITKYPQIQIVVGNVLTNDITWLGQFKILCNCDPIWGVHIYMNNGITVAQAEKYILDNYAITGGIYWITEWADTTGNIQKDNEFLNWMYTQPWIERAGYFTNRYNKNDYWVNPNWNVGLIDWGTNNLTNIGKWFVNIK